MSAQGDSDFLRRSVSDGVSTILEGGRTDIGDVVRAHVAAHSLGCPQGLRGVRAAESRRQLLCAVRAGVAEGCKRGLEGSQNGGPGDGVLAERAARAGRFASRLLNSLADEKVAQLAREAPQRYLRELRPGISLPELDVEEQGAEAQEDPTPDPRSGYSVECRSRAAGGYWTEEVPLESSDGQRICKLMRETNVHSLQLDVVAVERVVNPELEVRYREARSRLLDQNPLATELAFHGTDEANIHSICTDGFRMPDSPGMYGAGVYFGTNSSKCVWFVQSWNIDRYQGIEEPRAWPTVQRMLLCELAVGRYKEMQGGDYSTTLRTLRQEGYDSVKAVANSERVRGCRYEEWMLYDAHQVFPRYVVHFHKTHMPLASADPRYSLSADKWVDPAAVPGSALAEAVPEVGVIIGKFMPLHEGHVGVIRHALARCKRLNIVVCETSGEDIDGRQRMRMVSAEFPPNRKHIAVHFVNELAQVPHTDDEWRQWGDGIVGMCTDRGFGAPDIVFGGEPYVERLAEVVCGVRGAAPGSVRHCIVPRQEGVLTPVVSATELRTARSERLWGHVPPSVRPFLTLRVCVYGSESTGKTTMAAALADRYGTSWAKEFAREFLGDDQVESVEQIPQIAAGQLQEEDRAVRAANRIVFCDTDLLTTQIYSTRYFGECADWIAHEAASRYYDLYLHLDADVPWVDDPLRDLGAADDREDMRRRFAEALRRKGANEVLVTGGWDERWRKAVAAVDDLLQRPQRLRGGSVFAAAG